MPVVISVTVTVTTKSKVKLNQTVNTVASKEKVWDGTTKYSVGVQSYMAQKR